MSDRRIIFCHAWVSYNHPVFGETGSRVTFAAYDVVDSEDSQYAAAWTSPTDTFTRGAGRAISRTRLLTGGAQYVHEFTPFSSDYVDFWGTVFSDAAQYAPSRWSNVQISFYERQDQPAEEEQTA